MRVPNPVSVTWNSGCLGERDERIFARPKAAGHRLALLLRGRRPACDEDVGQLRRRLKRPLPAAKPLVVHLGVEPAAHFVGVEHRHACGAALRGCFGERQWLAGHGAYVPDSRADLRNVGFRGLSGYSLAQCVKFH